MKDEHPTGQSARVLANQWAWTGGTVKTQLSRLVSEN